VSAQSSAWAALLFQSGRDSFGPIVMANVADPFTDTSDGSEPLEELAPGAATVAQTISCGAVSWGPTMCGRDGLQGKVLNVPADMLPAGNSDHHYSYDDPNAGGEYDFWLATPPGAAGSTLTVGGAGFCRWGSDGTNCSDATATNIATSIGDLDPALIQNAESSPNGTLGYAISATALCADTTYVYPASASDGFNTNSSPACAGALAAGARPPEGVRWFLNKSDADVNATNNPPYVKAILRTIDRQHYGGTIVDTNWSGAPGLSMNFHRGNYNFAATEAGLGYAQNITLPISTNGINPATDIVFCTNGTC
jgi:hypothetical protein